MTAPDNWGEQLAPRDVHTPPSEVPGAQLPSQDQLQLWGKSIIEGIVKAVVKLVTGVLLPGPAGQQLSDWAGGIFDRFGNIGDLFGGADLTSGSLNLSTVWSNVVSVFINPLGFFANLVGGFLPNSQLGGHDASKITTGLFSQSQISGLVSKFLNYSETTDLVESFTGISGGSLGTLSGSNLITNGAFPSSITGWTDSTFTASWEPTIGRTAAGSMKMAATANSFAISTLIAAAPGDSVYFEHWFRTASITTGTAPYVALYVFTFDGSSTLITAVPIAFEGISVGTDTTWRKISGTFTVPAGVGYVAHAPQVSDATGGFAYFDDFKVTKGTGANLLPGLIGGVSPGTNLLTDVSKFLTNMFNGITRNSAVTATQDDTSTAIEGQTSIVSGTAASLAQLVASFGAGNPDADDFERTGSTLGGNWRSYFSSGSGPLGTPNGHELEYGGGNNTEWVTVKDDIQAATDHQTVSIVLAQSIPAWLFFTPLPFGGSIDIWLRCNNFTTYATRTGVRVRINSNGYAATAELANFTSGTKTVLDTWNLPSVPSSGAILDFEAGANGNPRTFTARLNGSEIDAFTDSGLVTALGASYLYRGIGGQNVAGQGSPKLSGWTAQG